MCKTPCSSPRLDDFGMSIPEQITFVGLYMSSAHKMLNNVYGSLTQPYLYHSQCTDFGNRKGEMKELSPVKDLEQAFWATMQYCLQAESLGTRDILLTWGVCTVNTALSELGQTNSLLAPMLTHLALLTPERSQDSVDP